MCYWDVSEDSLRQSRRQWNILRQNKTILRQYWDSPWDKSGQSLRHVSNVFSLSQIVSILSENCLILVSECLIVFGIVLDSLRRRLNNTFAQKSIILVFFMRFMGGRWDILSVRKRGGSDASSRVGHRSFLVLSHLIVLASPMLSYFVSSLPSKKTPKWGPISKKFDGGTLGMPSL